MIVETCAACRKSRTTTLGYDVICEEYVDMIKAGIIDPAKVTRGALENAASIAAMILTTEALITDIPEKEKAPDARRRRRHGLLSPDLTIVCHIERSFLPGKDLS